MELKTLEGIEIALVEVKNDEGSVTRRVRFGSPEEAKEVYAHFKGSPAIRATIEQLDSGSYISAYGSFELVSEETPAGPETFLVINDRETDLPALLEEGYLGEPCKVVFEEAQLDL